MKDFNKLNETAAEVKDTAPEVKEISDSDLDAVAGGFIRKIESRIPPFGSENNGDN